LVPARPDWEDYVNGPYDRQPETRLEETDSSPQRQSGPLASKCVHCGGNVPIVISAKKMECPFCGSDEPLNSGIAQRISRLRDKLKQRNAREQQLIGKQSRLGRSHGFGLLLVIVFIWILIGGWICIAFYHPTYPDQEPVPLGEFLFKERQPVEEFDSVTAGWWVIWLITTGFSFSIALYGATMVSMRRIVKFAFPRAPSFPGAPPGCRCCGADLPEKGAVRRCIYCNADHLVMGKRYQKVEKSLEQALSEIEEQLENTLAKRSRRANRAMMWGLTLPIVLPVCAPVGFFLGGTKPVLWGVAAFLLLFGVLMLIIAGFMGFPKLRTPSDVRVGDEILLHGKSFRAIASLNSNWHISKNNTYSTNITILVGGSDGKKQYAIQFEFADDDVMQPYLFKIQPGGDPLSTGKSDETVLDSVEPIESGLPPWDKHSRLWVSTRYSSGGRKVSDFRLWAEKQPDPDKPPLWTFGPRQKIP